MTEEHSIKNRERKQRIKAEVFAAYGGICTCCLLDDTRFLSIDHIDNSGSAHRRQIGRGDAIYRWLQVNNFPKDNFQLLCFNCNMAKHIYGVCPHETERRSLDTDLHGKKISLIES